MAKFDYEDYRRIMANAYAEHAKNTKRVYRRKLSDDLKIIVKIVGNEVVIYSIFKGNVCVSSFDNSNISYLHRYWNHETKTMTVCYPEYLDSFEAEEDQVLMSLPKGLNQSK